jgi:hypothetical protein
VQRTSWRTTRTRRCEFSRLFEPTAALETVQLDLATAYGWLTAAHLADQMLRGATRWVSASIGGRGFGLKSLRSPNDVPRKGKLSLVLQAASPPPPPVMADRDGVWLPSCIEMIQQQLDPPYARLIGGQHVALLRIFAAGHQLSVAAAHTLLDLMPTRWDKARALAVLIARVPLLQSVWFGMPPAEAADAHVPPSAAEPHGGVGARRRPEPIDVDVALKRREILSEMAEVDPPPPHRRASRVASGGGAAVCWWAALGVAWCGTHAVPVGSWAK